MSLLPRDSRRRNHHLKLKAKRSWSPRCRLAGYPGSIAPGCSTSLGSSNTTRLFSRSTIRRRIATARSCSVPAPSITVANHMRARRPARRRSVGDSSLWVPAALTSTDRKSLQSLSLCDSPRTSRSTNRATSADSSRSIASQALERLDDHRPRLDCKHRLRLGEAAQADTP